MLPLKLITVKIMNNEYSIRSDASADNILKIADYLNQELENLKTGAKSGTNTDWAIMAAFKAASDYFQASSDLKSMEERIEELNILISDNTKAIRA